MSDMVFDVDVRGLASGGAGVADLPDGRVVFVPRTTEGDRARVRIEKSRPAWARASLVRLLEPAATRVDPPCAHFDECGGCQLQHVAYADQLRWKGRFVTDALERIGGLEAVGPVEVVASPRELAYRSRMTFTLRRLRGGWVVAGMHAEGRPAHVVDIESGCLLPHQEIMEAWAALRGAWGASAGLLPSAGRLRLTLRRAPTAGEGGRLELVVEGGTPGWDAVPLFEACGVFTAVWHRADRDARGDDGAEGAEGAGVRLAAGASPGEAPPAFEQVNPEAAELLRARVLDWCGPPAEGAGTAVDAYCGSGVYARALAGAGWKVRGVESDPDAVAAARADGAGPPIVQGRVEDELPALLPADLVVLNPPRRGLDEAVPDQLVASPPARIVYVSCDPATLARDLKRLAPAFELSRLEAFDLFPQTAHVECVVELTRRTSDA